MSAAVLRRVYPPAVLRRVYPPAHFGDTRFWDVIDAIASENDVRKRECMSDAQWSRVFAIAARSMLPAFVLLALGMQRERIAEAQALGKSAEERYRDELAADRWREELAARARVPAVPGSRSSRGRKRAVVPAEDES